MADKQIVTTEDRSVVDMAKIREMAERYAEFLPGSKTVPLETRLTMAQIALAHGFDPFIGDIWPIEERKNINGDWQTTGYRIMVGITAWRRTAHATNEYWGRRFEKCTDEERKWLGAGANDLTIKCIVMRRKTGQQPMEFDGFGIFRAGEKSKMNPLQCVRLRAERDALKGAFPIGSGGGAVKIGVADDTGEEINGDVSHGPKWDVVTTGKPPIEQHNTPDPVSGYEPKFEPLDNAPAPSAEEVAIFGNPPAQKVEPATPAEPSQRKTYRISRVVFNGMTPEQWHVICDAFAASNPNWQKAGKPDMNHILASAGHAGFETINSNNIDEVFAAIIAEHANKAQA